MFVEWLLEIFEVNLNMSSKNSGYLPLRVCRDLKLEQKLEKVDPQVYS